MEIASLTATIDANTSGFTRAMKGVDAQMASSRIAMGHYVDANGRMRDANGRFVASVGDMDGAISRNRRGMLGFGGAGRTAMMGIAGLGLATGAAAAGIGLGLGIALRTGIGELKDYQTNVAATNAGLKSTHGVANVTRKSIEALSASIERKTGIDGDEVHAAQNLLLTFTKVRNEVGKNNDVFNQATKAAVDLSVRGFGSMDSTSKMLGKALNDPTKGVTALSRAGVTFTKGQKESIKAMQESGNLLGAQKMILKEVNEQVGGSAEAYGQTLPGAIDRLKRGLEAVAFGITNALAPALSGVIDWALANMPKLQAAIEGVLVQVQPYIKQFGTTIQQAFNGTGEAGARVQGAMTSLRAVMTALAPAFATIGQVAAKIIPVFGAYLVTAFNAVSRVAAAMAPIVSSAIEDIAPPLGRIMVVMLKFQTLMVSVLGRVLPPLITALAPVFKTVFGIIGDILDAIASLLEGDFTGAWRATVRAITALWITLPSKILSVLYDAVGALVPAAVSLGSKMIDGIASAIVSGTGRIGSAIVQAIKHAITNIDIPGFSPPEHAAAEAIGAPLARGVKLGFLAGTADLPEKIEGRLKAALERGRRMVERQQGVFQTAFGRFGSGLMRAFDAETSRGSAGIQSAGAALTPKEAELERERAAYDAAARLRDREDAAAALAAARAEGDAKTIADAQRRVDELKYQDKVASLEREAAAERAARDAETAKKVLNYEAEREAQRNRYEQQIADLEAFLQRRDVSMQAKNKKLAALLGSPDMKAAMDASGVNLGLAFAEGLTRSEKNVKAAVRRLANIVKDYLKLNSPAKRGALSTLDTWWTAMPKTLLAGVDTSMIGQVAAGIAAPDGGAIGGAGGGAGTTVINVTVQGTVTSERDLVDTIRAELLRTGQRNGSIFGGLA